MWFNLEGMWKSRLQLSLLGFSSLTLKHWLFVNCIQIVGLHFHNESITHIFDWLGKDFLMKWISIYSKVNSLNQRRSVSTWLRMPAASLSETVIVLRFCGPMWETERWNYWFCSLNKQLLIVLSYLLLWFLRSSLLLFWSLLLIWWTD